MPVNETEIFPSDTVLEFDHKENKTEGSYLTLLKINDFWQFFLPAIFNKQHITELL